MQEIDFLYPPPCNGGHITFTIIKNSIFSGNKYLFHCQVRKTRNILGIWYSQMHVRLFQIKLPHDLWKFWYFMPTTHLYGHFGKCMRIFWNRLFFQHICHTIKEICLSLCGPMFSFNLLIFLWKWKTVNYYLSLFSFAIFL